MAQITVTITETCPFCEKDTTQDITATIDDITQQDVECFHCGKGFVLNVNVEIDTWTLPAPTIYPFVIGD